MNKYPLFSNEVDLDKINFSNINYSNNKEYFYVSYDNEQTLYIQSPTFKFIQPIIQKDNTSHSFNELYLFLNPNDSSTFQFIELMNKLEIKGQEIIDNYRSNTLVIPIIKSCDIDENNEDDQNTNFDACKIKQVIKYMKIKLLDMTLLEYNKESITIEQLNKMVDNVNLKVIFEISMAWITKNKMGIYLKPIKIRAVDIPKITEVEFRDDSDVSDISHMEQTENIKQIINSQSLMSLGDSAFKTKYSPSNKHSQLNNIQISKINETLTTESIPILNTFIPSNGYNNMQTQLKNELNEIEHKNIFNKNGSNKKQSKSKTKSVSHNKNQYIPQQLYSQYSVTQTQLNSKTNSNSVSSEDITDSDNNQINVTSESSSVEIEDFGRKKKNIKKNIKNKLDDKQKKRGRPKKNEMKNTTKSSNDEKSDSIIKLKEILNEDDNYNEQYNQSESDSLNFDLDYNN